MTRRNMLVCMQRRCTKCSVDERDAPLDCEILHVLETRYVPVIKLGVHWFPRRSGKTTTLTTAARYLKEALKEPVYFVVLNQHMVELVKSTFDLDGVVLLNYYSVVRGLRRGLAPGGVFIDEVPLIDVPKIMQEMAGCWLVAAYHSYPELVQ